jgi:hypothetical protein
VEADFESANELHLRLSSVGTCGSLRPSRKPDIRAASLSESVVNKSVSLGVAQFHAIASSCR